MAVASAPSACSSLLTPMPGSCATNANGYKCDGIVADPQTIGHVYPRGAYIAKVIVEQGGAAPAQDTALVVADNAAPSVSNVIATQPDYCSSGLSGTVIGWTYSDPEGDGQSAFQVQFISSGNIIYDSGKILSSSNTYSPPPNSLNYNSTYIARVRAWDSSDASSGTADSAPWAVPAHSYPSVDFNLSPASPSANQRVQLINQTIFYDGGGVRTYLWDFGDGMGSSMSNPTHIYTAQAVYSTALTATDSDGYSCNMTKAIDVGGVLPIWKEVAP